MRIGPMISNDFPWQPKQVCYLILILFPETDLD
jgi:hypothetical protein